MRVMLCIMLVWCAHIFFSHLTNHAPFQDGPVLLVRQCNILELLARFAINHAQDMRELRPKESERA